MKEKILLFTGAGIGHPLGLPLTSEFNDVLDLIPDPLNYVLRDYLGDDFYDVEKTMFELDKLSNKETNLYETIVKRVISKHPYNQKVPEIDNFKKQAKSTLTNLKSSVFDLLGQVNVSKSRELYKNILTEIIEQYDTPLISIFTTNYDLSFEVAMNEETEFLDKNKLDIENGFTRKRKASPLIYEPNYSTKWKEGEIEYFKLHGSLDWHKSGNNITMSGASTPPRDVDKVPILYPGYKGTPIFEPFKSIHDKLLSRLMTCDKIIVVGFAFRDPYINNLFETILRTRKDVPLFFINPCDIKEFPTESMAKYFKDNYPKFQHFKKGMEIKTNPIGLSQIEKKQMITE